MTDPAVTNAGLSGLVGVATSAAGDGGALHGDQAAQAAGVLRGLHAGQDRDIHAVAPDDLASKYVFWQSREAARGARQVDGIIDYESDLLALNASGRLSEPLDLIYPSDGVVTANYPLSLFSSAAGNPGARGAYQRLVNYLLTPGAQGDIMRLTWHRPANSRVPLDSGLRHGVVFELPFPASQQVLDTLVAAYNGTLPPVAAPAPGATTSDTAPDPPGDR
jgi:Ca-activated chloride channel family protein